MADLDSLRKKMRAEKEAMQKATTYSDRPSSRFQNSYKDLSEDSAGINPHNSQNNGIQNNTNVQKSPASTYHDDAQNINSSNNGTNYVVSEQAEYYFKMGIHYSYLNDEVSAINEYKKAAQLGHPKAMYEIAADYSESDDSILGFDPSKAEYWARKAIENGEFDGYDVLSDLYVEEEKWQESLRELEEGVKRGSLLCRQNLGEIYYYGDEDYGIELDEEKAFQILSSADWDGDFPLAYAILGHLYKDFQQIEKAKDFYVRALNYNPKNEWLKYYLGELYVFNENVRDYSRGKNLLESAANDGNADAMNLLGVMYCNGEGVPENITTGLNWLQKSAEGGYTDGMVNLYRVLVDQNIDTDSSTAMYWLNRAAELGNQDAIQIKEEMVEQERKARKSAYNSGWSSSNSSFTREGSFYNKDSGWIKNKVMRILEDKLTLERGEAASYKRIVEDLGADSLDAIEIIMEMEKEFNLTIPDSDAEKIRTVGDIVSYIKSHT